MNFQLKYFHLSLCLFNLLITSSVLAADQNWDDANANNIWDLTGTNWDSDSIWTNGNNAIFGGNSETVELGDAIAIANVTFITNGYEIADTNADGSFSIAGSPTVITVASNYTAKISDSVDGSGGLTKEGTGTLEYTTSNTYAGVTHIKEGILKLAFHAQTSMGATGTGNEVIIEEGAALDLNENYTGNRNDDITASGTGFNGSGAIFSSAINNTYNKGFRDLTLVGDTTISVAKRWDLSSSGTFTGNGYTLTKIGGSEIAISRAMNDCTIIVNEGGWTVQNELALGDNTYDTFINNSKLLVWGEYKIPERIVFTGTCTLGEGSWKNTATFNGHLTASNNVYLGTNNYGGTNGLAITGYVDGTGGFTKSYSGWCYITGSTNSYSGTTKVSYGRELWVGQPDGSIEAGRLGTGPVIADGYLYYDNTGAYTISNQLSGAGIIIVRNGGDMTLSDSTSSASPVWYLCDGSLTLTNNTSLILPNKNFTMSDHAGAARYTTATSIVPYPVDPGRVKAELTVTEGCLLKCNAFICGNGSGGSMTSIINHIGGTIESTGSTAENNGFRLGHYPAARTTYTLSGGTITCGDNQDMCMGTDGNGWLKVMGGEVNTTRITVNERVNTGGYGRLTVCGGVVNIGTTDPSIGAITNAITTDYQAGSLVELGGCEDGGEIRAVTNIYITVDATLVGTNDNAITFNSNGNTIYFSGQFNGTGGFNLTGGGTMEISTSDSTCNGQINVTDGSTLKLCADNSLPNATVYVGEGSTLDFCEYGQNIGGVYGPGKVIYPGTLIILR
ncbi:MAG: hypothetical protein PF904_05250 [Kiritimatiellae bacterium]|jgi:fibronectin-binding autotransporter adhesin|nr:hypothetical protein [Kiritimatiellia bacterium]